MIQVGLLTIEQKNQLVGQLYTPDVYFNPTQDCNGNWFISTQEIDYNTNPNFTWVTGLLLTDYCRAADPTYPTGSV